MNKSLNEFYNELERLVPDIKSYAGYFRYNPKIALKFANWCERFQELSKKQIARHGELVFTDFDVETTGLEVARKFEEGLAGITDIAGLKIYAGKYCGNKILEDGTQLEEKNDFEFQTLVNPGIEIPENVQKITNITNEMVANATPQYTAIRQFKEFSKNTILVGHNIGDSLQNKSGFDITRVLGPICNRYFNQNVETLLENAIDTKPLFQYLIAGVSHTNEKFAELLGIKLVGAHRAMPDVRVNALAFSKLVPILLKCPVSKLRQEAELNLAGRDFYLNYIQSKADFNISNDVLVELSVKLDPKYNVGRKRSEAKVLYNPYTEEFSYQDLINEKTGNITPGTVLKTEIPEATLRRQVRLLTKENDFYKAIEQYSKITF